MNGAAFPEGWLVLSTTEVQGEANVREAFPSKAWQGLGLPNEIQSRIKEDLDGALFRVLETRREKEALVTVQILYHPQSHKQLNKSEIIVEDQHNHSPPVAWNYFIIERNGNQMAAPLIELYLFTER